MQILNYDYDRDYSNIVRCAEEEGWKSLYITKKEQYANALRTSKTLVAYEGDQFAGYIRGISDGFFTLFVPEIIVVEKFRRKGCGKKLLDALHDCYPSARMELISDADDFYLKQGFREVGTGMRK